MIRALAAVAVVVSSGLCLAAGAGPAPQAARALPEVLRTSIALYPTLTSYADTGTVVKEVPGITEKSQFTTYVRNKPTRDLYLDYQMIAETFPASKITNDKRANRYVLWMVNGEMQKYSFASRQHERIPPDAQVGAVDGLNLSTHGVSILIPGLIYAKAKLPNSVLQIEQASVSGSEVIGKRRCHKVVGTAAAYYPSGARTSVRPVTVWIDAETNLIRRVLEGTPEGYPSGSFQRVTITYEPQANPEIDDARFRFTVPRS